MVLLPLLATLLGCPPTNSTPCETDADCGAEGRCRRGACGPICIDDTECGTEQVCQLGACVPSPECSADTDCASGFTCRTGACRCTNDTACAANQLCDDGACIARPRCTSDADCASVGRKCEITQGLCIPACTLPTDCAPGVDPRIALALYNCRDGSCLRRCINDATCGTGLICSDDGTCARPQCKTQADCAAGEYCSSATTGRCVQFKTCATSTDCSANFECRAFAQGQCPPGFNCAQKICQELPRCFTDNDCQASFPGQTAPISYCSDQHCQPTTPCSATVACPSGRTCVAEVCVPSVCRGHGDCPSGQFCVEGACKTPPANADVAQLRISPTRAWVAAGSTITFKVIGFELGGVSSPITNVTWEVLDSGGAASTAATAASSGVVTGVSAATVRVRASLPGGSATPAEATLSIIAPPSTGKTVVVLDSSTRKPLQGVTVVGCDAPPDAGACTAAVTVTTDAQGAANFTAFTAGAPATFDIASPATRSGDGLPMYERASLLGASGDLLLVPLDPNPVHGNAGIVTAISFTSVHTSGNYWAGFALTSLSDPVDTDLTQLLGEPFLTTVPGLQQRIPVPGAVVAFTSIGFGIPTEVKGTSYGLSQAGRRNAIAFAGKAQQDQLIGLRSTDVLAYTGAMDYALQAFVSPPHRARVPDTVDLDSDGLCQDPQRCPDGREDLPDYANFPRLSLGPSKTQDLRTEVVVPNLPSGLDTVVISAFEGDGETGLLPLGLSSRAAGPPTIDGSRPVSPVLLRSGTPYAGIELGSPGIWALGVSLNAQGLQDPGSRTSARLSRGNAIPTRVVMKPFLPFVEGSSLSPSTFSPGQPSWNAVASAGADMVRIVITGAQNRRVLYVPMIGSASAIRLPDRAAGVGTDPLTEPMARLEVQPLDFTANTTAQDALDAPGVNLLDLALILDGYSRSAQ